MLTLRAVLAPDELLDQIRTRYSGLVQTTTWGERVFFYNPGGALSHGVYFLSLKERDSANDVSSRLDEQGAYRVNVSLAPLRYHAMFGAPPDRASHHGPSAAALVATDVLAPHPVYAWLGWAAIVNPTAATLERLWPILYESYALAQQKHASRLREGGRG